MIQNTTWGVLYTEWGCFSSFSRNFSVHLKSFLNIGGHLEFCPWSCKWLERIICLIPHIHGKGFECTCGPLWILAFIARWILSTTFLSSCLALLGVSFFVSPPKNLHCLPLHPATSQDALEGGCDRMFSPWLWHAFPSFRSLAKPPCCLPSSRWSRSF